MSNVQYKFEILEFVVIIIFKIIFHINRNTGIIIFDKPFF
jgi:hypothetical protein